MNSAIDQWGGSIRKSDQSELMIRRILRRAPALALALLMLAARAGADVVSLDGEGWRIAIDPRNEGRRAHWERGAVAEAKPAAVPSTIQEYFPAYHGVAWYSRAFDGPAVSHAGDRYALHF